MAGKDEGKGSGGGNSGKETATIDLSHTSQKGAEPKGIETRVIKGESR